MRAAFGLRSPADAADCAFSVDAIVFPRNPAIVHVHGSDFAFVDYI